MTNPAYPDLWSRLQSERRDVVLYGMGNGADKILRVCAEKGIPVREVFASDDFVRGQLFHGKRVLRWAEVKERYPTENLTVLLAFATSLPDVLQNIRSVAVEVQLYVPDVPVCGDGLFDAAFVQAHREELAEARALLCDEESRRIFDRIVHFKLTGDLETLLEARSTPEEAMRELIRPSELRTVADLGAYTGDSVRELLNAGAAPETIYAMEPDTRSFRKLSAYAAQETRTRVIPVPAAAWDCEQILCFETNGSRSSAVNAEGSRSFTADTGNNSRFTMEADGNRRRAVDADAAHNAADHFPCSDRRAIPCRTAEGLRTDAGTTGRTNTTATVPWDGSGLRSVEGLRGGTAASVKAMPLDRILGDHSVDYIKYDVEGAEAHALAGSAETIRKFAPTLLVSLYHRNEDLFALPLWIHRQFPDYRGFYLRRFGGVPAWDLNLYVRKK